MKGTQVAPAELEALLLSHPAVNDCAVIGVLAEREGEVPKAFVVPNQTMLAELGPSAFKEDIAQHVRRHKSKNMWLEGGVEFAESIPRNPSGKMLRRVLREQEKERRRLGGSRL